MAVAALVLYGIWFALTIGLRIVIQLRRSGDTGFRVSVGPRLTTGWGQEER